MSFDKFLAWDILDQCQIGKQRVDGHDGHVSGAAVKSVLLNLIKHANTKSGRSYPSQRTIHAKTELGAKTVWAALQVLETLRHVEAEIHTKLVRLSWTKVEKVARSDCYEFSLQDQAGQTMHGPTLEARESAGQQLAGLVVTTNKAETTPVVTTNLTRSGDEPVRSHYDDHTSPLRTNALSEHPALKSRSEAVAPAALPNFSRESPAESIRREPTWEERNPPGQPIGARFARKNFSASSPAETICQVSPAEKKPETSQTKDPRNWEYLCDKGGGYGPHPFGLVPPCQCKQEKARAAE
jgi:hypothetical protein